MKKAGHRIYRHASEEEKARHAEIRRQVAEELPEVKARARRKLDELRKTGVALRHAVTVLKAERERQGLSLAEMNQRTGIDRAALSRLENNEDANPTVNTLAKYAAAVGKQLVVLLTDASA